jgi:hypothetical protein
MNPKKGKKGKMGYIKGKKGMVYFCEMCGYKCGSQYHINRHYNTKKHIKKKGEKGNNDNPFKCENCGKNYKHSQGLSKHKKKCKNECNIDVTDVTENVTNVTKSEMSKMKCPEVEMSKMKCPEIEMSENIASTELEKGLLKLLVVKDKRLSKKDDQIFTLMNMLAKNGGGNSNNTNTNKSHNVNSLNTQNNNLTVNVYLNEHCKDAMNITDFVKKVKVSLADLQYTNANGFAEGISNIFMKQLNDMKPTERPIHCADVKRCKFYVKDENNDWKKDTENKKINQSISDVTVKQIRMLKVWEGEHPYWNSNTIVGLKRQELICQIMGGRDMEAQNKNRKKIKQMIGETIKLKDAMKEAQESPQKNKIEDSQNESILF